MSDHLKACFEGLVTSLSESEGLAEYLTRVYDHDHSQMINYLVESRKVTINCMVGDTTDEDPIHNESTLTDIIPTQFVLYVDSKFPKKEDYYLSDDGPSMLDLEFEVISALQETAYWGVESHMFGWVVDSISRNQDFGDENYLFSRVEIVLSVDVLLDRTDGPAR